ncbi:MAG: hypothetical protein LEGION0398_MBIBDBAK_00107 [Legionellaceae bacterium]
MGHPSPQKGQKLSTSMPAAALAVLRTLVMTRLGVITSLPQMTCRPFCGPYILPSAKHPALRSTRDYRPRSFVASLADSEWAQAKAIRKQQHRSIYDLFKYHCP